MPRPYENYRDSLISKGVPAKEAKRRAAIWYNKHFPDKTPATRYHKGEKKS